MTEIQKDNKNIANVPPLRFPGFTGEWEVKKLGEIAKKIGDGLHGTPKYVEDSDFYFINGNNIVSGKISLNENTKKVDIETFIKNDKGLKENTLLISINGTIGNIARYNNEKVMLGKSVGYFNFKKKSDFFFFALQTKLVQDFFASELTGSTIKNLSLKTLREAFVSLPSDKEQQKIASFLSLIDERIQTQIKIIEQLETLIKGLSEKLFSQEIRFKGFAEKWSVKKLGGLATFYSGGTPLTSKKEYFDGNIPFIRSGEINSNVTEQFINELGLKKSSAKMVEIGDILYALYGATSGEVAISKINGAINQAVLCIKSQQNHYFIYSYLFHKKEYIINKYLQGGQGNLSADIVKQIELPIPTLEEQTVIANFLSAIDTKIQTERNILDKYQSQKQYLLQNLFI